LLRAAVEDVFVSAPAARPTRRKTRIAVGRAAE